MIIVIFSRQQTANHPKKPGIHFLRQIAYSAFIGSEELFRFIDGYQTKIKNNHDPGAMPGVVVCRLMKEHRF